jgi:hypothetical protein
MNVASASSDVRRTMGKMPMPPGLAPASAGTLQSRAGGYLFKRFQHFRFAICSLQSESLARPSVNRYSPLGITLQAYDRYHCSIV